MNAAETNIEAKSISEHVDELRKKAMIALAVFFTGTIISHFFNSEIIAFLLKTANNQNLIFLSPLDPLFFILQIDFIGGVIFSFPVIIWLLFSYISPALSDRIKQRVVLFYISSTLLLILGLAYSVLVVAPISLKFLLSITIPGIENSFSVQKYISFLITQAIIVIIVFQIPIVIIGGISLGILKTKLLALKRKYIYVGLMIALAVITPTTDLFSLAILFVPCVIIFEISLIVGKVVEKINKQKIE